MEEKLFTLVPKKKKRFSCIGVKVVECTVESNSDKSTQFELQKETNNVKAYEFTVYAEGRLYGMFVFSLMHEKLLRETLAKAIRAPWDTVTYEEAYEVVDTIINELKSEEAA